MILTALLARGGPVAERMRSVSAGGNIALASSDDEAAGGALSLRMALPESLLTNFTFWVLCPGHPHSVQLLPGGNVGDIS
jgi:hypothetical protein